MFRKMIEASLDRVVRSMVTDEMVERHVSAQVLESWMSHGVRSKIAEIAAGNIMPDEVAKHFGMDVLAAFVDHAAIAEHLDTCEIAEHVDMQEVTNAVCENVTPDEIVDCLLQRVG